MKPYDSAKRFPAVALAVGLVLALSVSLAVRIWARGAETTSPPDLVSRPVPPRGTVPPPRPIVPTELPTPFCWGCSWNMNAPLEFQLDLDLLAPLGDGTANAALWFEQFARDGTADDDSDGHKRRLTEVTIDGKQWRVLPEDDPLLVEAEPWVDQATLSFYPEVWEPSGADTPLPDLLLMLDLARSWTARGKRAGDSERARADFRRAIRLGRLLRQDDVVLIQDLVAIACIRIGAEALYESAREEGDAATMTATALVLADKDAMRQMTARRITLLERAVRVEDPEAPTLKLKLTDDELDSIVELIREVPERRFRFEGLIGMHVVKHLGTPSQRDRARALLDDQAGSADELTARLARRLRDADLDEDAVREMFARTR